MTENRSVKEILVVELWNIGDVILLLPFLQQLRVLFPNARTTLLGRSHARELLEGTRLVDEFLDADLAWQNDLGVRQPSSYSWLTLWRVIRRLRRKRYDIAFQCRPHVREYVIFGLIRATRRVGVRKRRWDRLLTDRVDIPPFSEQKAASWLRLLEPFGGQTKTETPTLPVSDEAGKWADAFLKSKGIGESDRLIGIHPGASVPEKRWPLDRFDSVVSQLTRTRGVRPLVFVDPGGHGSELAKPDGRIAVKPGLAELVALLARCELVVCNDSGPMHIAGAVGVRTVAVFGSGIDRAFAPLGTGHFIVAATGSDSGSGVTGATPRYDVADVPTERVMDAIRQALG